MYYLSYTNPLCILQRRLSGGAVAVIWYSVTPHFYQVKNEMVDRSHRVSAWLQEPIHSHRFWVPASDRDKAPGAV